MTGKFKVSLNGKEYPFCMTLRQRGAFSNLRGKKQDNEQLLSFLYERFLEGWILDKKNVGATATEDEIAKYEEELAELFVSEYEKIVNEVMISLGILSRDTLNKVEKKIDEVLTGDFLSEALAKSVEQKT